MTYQELDPGSFILLNCGIVATVAARTRLGGILYHINQVLIPLLPSPASEGSSYSTHLPLKSANLVQRSFSPSAQWLYPIPVPICTQIFPQTPTNMLQTTLSPGYAYSEPRV